MKQYFKEQLDKQPALTQEMLDNLIQGRKDANASYDDLNDPTLIGDKWVMGMVRKKPNEDGRCIIHVLKFRESKINEDLAGHTYSDTNNEMPRFDEPQ